MNSGARNEVMIVSAEASSALFALRLLEHWKKEKKDLHAFGVGSAQMESLGFERLGKSEEMAVVGLTEVIEHYGRLKEVFNHLVAEAARRRPRVVVVMDYPEFNLRLAEKLHELKIPVVYYISPQVWVWRKGRVKTIQKYCDQVLTLFPFEVEFYKKENVPVEFVGHPLLDEIKDQYFSSESRQHHRSRYGFTENDCVIGLMPGSRKIELREHLPLQLQTAQMLSRKYPHLKFALMVAPTFTLEQVKNEIPDSLTASFVLMKDEPFEMIHLVDFVLVASGTATLQVGLMHKPMVIMYKTKWLTYWFFKAIIDGEKRVGLPNLILKKDLVPECLQAKPETLFKEMSRYLDEPDHAQYVQNELKKLQGLLGNKGVTARVAQNLERYFQ